MATLTETPAKGKVLSAEGDKVVFQPADTNYRLHLQAGSYAGPVERVVHGVIRATARKLWTIPAGGSFVTPIVGPPHVIQGRIRSLDEQTMVVQAGPAFTVTLPREDSAYDLTEGPLGVGTMVNVVLFAGATFELAAP